MSQAALSDDRHEAVRIQLESVAMFPSSRNAPMLGLSGTARSFHLPPLRERAIDIPMLVDSFMQRGTSAKHRMSVEPEAMACLQHRDWPGNVRQLRNVLDRARLLADDGVIRMEYLPDDLGLPSVGLQRTAASMMSPSSSSGPLGTSDEGLARTVAAFQGTRRELAIHLGLSERTLYRRLKAIGLA